MAKPTDTAPPWAQAGLYPDSTYPLTLPWGAPNPLAGQDTPWSSEPRLNAAGLAAFANTGLTPQVPTDAAPFNSYIDTIRQWANWVEQGSNMPDADAHIMETDAGGFCTSLAFGSQLGFAGLGGLPAVFPNGAELPDGAKLELVDSAEITGGSTSRVQAATIEGAVIEITSPGAAPTVRQLGAGTPDVLLWNDGNINEVHYSTSGYIYATGDQEAATALAATTNAPTTTVRITSKIALNVRVICEGWGQRSASGDVNITLEASDGAFVWSTIGNAQVSTWVNTGGANLWSPFRIERVFAAGTSINRLYRCHILGLGGATARIRESSIRVVPDRY